MKTYNVYNGEYPFDIFIAQLEGPEDAVEALQIAIDKFGEEYPHPVIEEVQPASMYVH